ncbi:VWA domain-containing protein [Arachnia propionica]|nr:VWA domain-containing protein [Arachnia propionica]
MDERLTRWRLVLGEGSEGLGELEGMALERAAALDFLYDRESGARSAGSGGSSLTVPAWINQVEKLFPKRTIEIIQEDALERYGMLELVTNKDLLERVEPSEALLQAVLRTKHLMSEDVLGAARQLVRKVVQQLVERMRPRIVRSFLGRRDPQRRSHHKVASNFDPKRTIRTNLKNWSPELGKLVISDPVFVSRTRRHSEKWQFIIAVDQSGSMADSVIHSAVTASIFHQMPALRTHLVTFDTSVVDLTSEVQDPVETLMRVQLGGGTDIARAVTYCEGLVHTPRRAMFVLITDLYEGGSEAILTRSLARMVDAGVKVLVLGALTADGAVGLNEDLARRLARRGVKVATMTPHDLADWVTAVIA